MLFPGLVLPLHIFEERYRQLVRDLLDRPEDDRRFGVVSITLGHEVGAEVAPHTAEIGCVATVREVEPSDDGRYDIVATGGERFQLGPLDDSLPYLQAEVTSLPDEPGEQPGAYAPGVKRLFDRYCELLRGVGASVRAPDEIPDDPTHLSYLVGAAVLLGRQQRQELLEAPDVATRLREELRLLRREISVMRGLPTLPAYDLLSKDFSSN